MSVVFTVRPRADRDLDEIADYLAGEGGLDIGLRFLAEAYATFALIAFQPDMGWRCKQRHAELQGARVFAVRGPFSKFLIFYRNETSRIDILRVLHGAQDLEMLFGKEGVE